MTCEAQLVLVGTIVGTHGVRGEVKVAPANGSPDRFAGVNGVFMGSTSGRNCVTVSIESQRPHKTHALLKLAGVDSVDRAEGLKGQGLFLPQTDLPDLPDGEYYTFMLIGLECVSGDGEILGRVVDVLDLPSNDVIVVRSQAGSEFLVPAVEDFIIRVDLKAERLVVDDRPGLR